VPAPLKSLAERKLRKLERLLGGSTHAHIVLAGSGRVRSAEVTLQSRRLTLAAKEQNAEPAAALAAALVKLARQVQKHLGKRRQRKGGTALGTAAAERPVPPPPPPRAADGPRIIRSRRGLPKSMLVEDAARVVQGSEEGFLVFRDVETARLSVLFRRTDGNLGLFEPEA
jgi:putative sigma-54 modulation protein